MQKSVFIVCGGMPKIVTLSYVLKIDVRQTSPVLFFVVLQHNQLTIESKFMKNVSKNLTKIDQKETWEGVGEESQSPTGSWKCPKSFRNAKTRGPPWDPPLGLI